MLTLRYFARYREALACADEQLTRPAHVRTLADLQQHLLERGGAWTVLDDARLRCARNQVLCSLDSELADDDEIAFFPMVTGG